MGLSHEHVGPKILAKIQIYILTRAELLLSFPQTDEPYYFPEFEF